MVGEPLQMTSEGKIIMPIKLGDATLADVSPTQNSLAIKFDEYFKADGRIPKGVIEIVFSNNSEGKTEYNFIEIAGATFSDKKYEEYKKIADEIVRKNLQIELSKIQYNP
jgi:hypothetical protein